MKKPRIDYYNFDDELFGISLTIMVTADTQAAEDELLKVYGLLPEFYTTKPEDNSGVYYRIKTEENTKKFNCQFIWLHDHNRKVLMHELVHMVFQTFTDRGVPLRVENDEVFAYYLTYWYEKANKSFNNRNRGGKSPALPRPKSAKVVDAKSKDTQAKGRA